MSLILGKGFSGTLAALFYWLFSLASLGQSHLVLPGEAQPVLLGGTPDSLWVLRQATGEMPQWWTVQGTKLQRVKLPEKCRFAAPLPDGAGLVVLVDDQAQVYTLDSQGQLEVENQINLSKSLQGVHPRLDGVFETLGNRHFLPLFEPGRLLILEAEPRQGLKQYLVPRQKKNQVGNRFGVGSFLQPKTTAGFTNLVWMEQKQCFYWDPQTAADVGSKALPSLKNMEQAVPIPTANGLNWLIHGGERGDLGSFGWRLVNQKGSDLANGKGIVTRFGLLRDDGPQRLLIWTVSQKIRSQLWAAMSGSRNFTGQVLQFEQGKWQFLQKTEIKLAKGKKERAFEILWQADINQDGRGDLVAADEKNGLRVYLSKTDGRFSNNARKINQKPHELLVLKRVLYAAEEKGMSWLLTPVRL